MGDSRSGSGYGGGNRDGPPRSEGKRKNMYRCALQKLREAERRGALVELSERTTDQPPRAVRLCDARTASRNLARRVCAEQNNASHFRYRCIESSGRFRRHAFEHTAKKKWKKRRRAMCRAGGRERDQMFSHFPLLCSLNKFHEEREPVAHTRVVQRVGRAGQRPACVRGDACSLYTRTDRRRREDGAKI